MSTVLDVLAERRARPADWPRIRFAAGIAMFGAAVGSVAVLVNVLSSIPFYKDAGHMALVPSLFLAISGALAGALVTAPFAYHMYGDVPVLEPKKTRKPRNLPIWWVLGVGYGLLYPMVMGAFFLPAAIVLRLLISGILGPVDVINELMEILMASLLRAVTVGGPMLFTSAIAGVVFGTGAWVIDQVNASSDRRISAYGTWAVSALLATTVVVLVFAVSPETLRGLG